MLVIPDCYARREPRPAEQARPSAGHNRPGWRLLGATIYGTLEAQPKTASWSGTAAGRGDPQSVGERVTRSRASVGGNSFRTWPSERVAEGETPEDTSETREGCSCP